MILFSVFNIENITIPGFIKIIKTNIFKGYNNLQHIDFD